MTSEKADYKGTPTKEVRGRYLDVSLIEQCKAWSAIADPKCAIFDPRSFQLVCCAVHRFDSFVRCVVGWGSGLKCFFEFIELLLKACHCASLRELIGSDILMLKFVPRHRTAS